MPKSQLKFVDFGGRSLPIWEFDGLYYVTFDQDTIEKCNQGRFYFEGKKPDKNWVSGSTPDIAVSAGVYNAAIKMFGVALDQAKALQGAINEAAKVAKRADSNADPRNFSDPRDTGGR